MLMVPAGFEGTVKPLSETKGTSIKGHFYPSLILHVHVLGYVHIPGCQLLVGCLQLSGELMECFHLSTDCSVCMCVREREEGKERKKEGVRDSTLNKSSAKTAILQFI